MKYLLTCSAGLEKIAKNEILKQGGKIIEIKDRLVFFEGNDDLIAKVNLWSRVGNKLYIILGEQKKVDNFDVLFDLIYSIDWKKYINKNSPILSKATSIKSTLNSTPALQKITKKAIVKKITGSNDEVLLEDLDKNKYEILTFLIEDICYILLNTSGETLYKRGYRNNLPEAPIKESLAAGIIMLSNWKYSDNFYDFFVGSGTFVIEALMIAKNIAPGINRKFAFEDWDFYYKNHIKTQRKNAKTNIFEKKYNIIASDINPEMIEMAKENAKNAGVLGDIKFEIKDFKEYKKQELSGILISNPPYGLRLKDDDLKGMYKDLISIFEKNKELKGGFITSYNDFNYSSFKNRKLYNGNEMCYLYLKK